ncbi:MAG TPA: CHAD domain-containing protein [Nitrospiraceae bacterium]|nr:CHAD domain-containing protein [Nitrospiraceae bacterium]
MGYVFQEHETVSDGVKRIALEQLDKVFQYTKSGEKNRDEAIHDARVSLKKLRALLRLVQVKSNTHVLTQERVCYRNAARRMSGVRDTTAIIEAFDKLTNHYADQLAPKAFSELRKPFLRTQKRQQGNKSKALADVARMLKSARQRVSDWAIEDDGFAVLRSGFKRVYRKGRATMVRAQSKPSVENFHEWRKRVKDLGYQIRLLRPIWEGMLDALANEFDKLADYLSHDHDLALLRQRMVQNPSEGRTPVKTMVALIDQRRKELQVEAKRLGIRMYAEKPSAFVRRIEVYWRAWCLKD